MCRYYCLVPYKSIRRRINHRRCFSVYSFINRFCDKRIERFTFFICGDCRSTMQFRGNADIENAFIRFFWFLPYFFAKSKIVIYC